MRSRRRPRPSSSCTTTRVATPTPSGADIQLTRRLVKAGDVLGIDVLDHVVIGDGGEFSSLRDLGHM